jgi:Predicted nucleoside-diphosphate sugar epimerases
MYLPAVNIAIPRHHVKHVAAWALLDVLLMVGAYTLVYLARLPAVSPADLLRLMPAVLVAALGMVAALYLAGVYHQMWLHTSGHRAGLIVNAAAAATAAMLLVDVLLYPRPLPVSVILIGNALATSGFIALRYRGQFALGTLRNPLRPRQAASPSTRVLIVGAGEAGQMLALQLRRRSQRDRYTVVGFIDDDPRKQGLFIEGCSVLGTRHAIPAVVHQYGVSLIVMAIHNISGQDFRAILAQCETQTRASS